MTWCLQEPRDDPCCSHSRRPTALVTDVLVWVEGYTQLVAVLAPCHPGYVGEFMAYLRIIVRASRNYEGVAWASYDVAFRRQAAATGDLYWGRIDPTLYDEAFTGRARLIARCRYCLGDSHPSEECEYAPHLPVHHPQQLAPMQHVPPQQPRQSGGNRRSAAGSVEICLRFNWPDCYLKGCRFAHLCSQCHRPHPLADCVSGGQDTRRGRSRSPPRKS